MYGYLIAASDILSEEEKARYKACYCGLCRCLEKNYGELYRLTLNYDLTFLALILNAMYEPEEISGSAACIAHPFKKNAWWQSRYTEYAADITVALAYLKCRDDWLDDGKPVSRAEARLLEKKYREVSSKYSELFSAIEADMQKLMEIEKSGGAFPDECSHCFGRIMGNIFAVKDDRWKKDLYSFGFSLGEFVYLVDAAVDLERDTRHGNYNPFSTLAGNKDNGAYFKEILEITLGDCVEAFDRLPIVLDSVIIKNILYFGLWQNFYKQYPLKEETTYESGSI